MFIFGGLLSALLAVAASDVVPWILTGASVLAALIAANAHRSSAKVQKASVSSEEFERVTHSQAIYNGQLFTENGVLRERNEALSERLHQCEQKCRDDTERLEGVINTWRLEVKNLRAKIALLEGDIL